MIETYYAESVEAVYPLSPLQQGMLFHSLYGRQSGVDIEQLLAELPEELNVPAFQRAWQRVVERHAILRTGFHWSETDQPVQQVKRDVRIHWDLKDWQGLPLRQQKNRLKAHLEADRRRGFDLSLAPLMRLTMIRLRPARYWLVWSFHHLLLDGRSLVVLFNELFAFYDAIRSEYILELQAPPSFREHVLWLVHQDLALAEGFWRRRFQGLAARTRLPSGLTATSAALDAHPDPAEREMRLSASLTAALRHLAWENELTLNILIQGAWALVLSRDVGQSDVVFGAIRACRHGRVAGVESIVGMLINTVPVRVQVEPSAKFIDWLKTLRAHWIELRPHENTPLAKVQEWVGTPRGQPLFETLLNVQDPPWDAALRAQGGRWNRRRFCVKSQPNYPLAVDVYSGRQITVKMWYNRRRLSDEWIARLLDQLSRVLQGMVEYPRRRVHELPWLSDRERQRVLVEWNRTELSVPRDGCAPELIAEQCRLRPDATAVTDAEETISYAELNRRADRLSRRLRELDVGPEQLVGVCLERSARMVAAMLGIWKAGGAYVPLEASYPDERLRYIVADAKVRVVLTQRTLAKRMAFPGVSVICVEDLDQPNSIGNDWTETSLKPGIHTDQGNRAQEASRTTQENRPTQAGQLAYVIYTSGSTGRPKGVEIEHGSLANLIAWHRDVYGVSADDRATQLAGTGYDACVWELWPYLAAGASVFVADERTRLSPRLLIQWLAEHRVTIGFLPTPLAHAVMDEPWPAEIALRALLTGGEKLLRHPGPNFSCALFNNYGPTENTVVTTWAEVKDDDVIPIGRPVANAQVYVLDSCLEPVPIGVPGELCVAGRNLARGYRNQPGVTAERFLPNPFSDTPGGRLYRTGDLVRYRADGMIEFLGRIDQQLKIRGHRVEPGEIESVFSQHEDVEQAAVALRENGNHDLRLVAFVVRKRGRGVSGVQLREFLKGRLPEYMVPAALVFLDTLPLTANGKVNRDALPDPKPTSEPAQDLAPPRSPVEEALATIWEEVLSVDRVSIHDNFFDLGGHSMLATQVMSRLYRLFQIDFPVRDLFECPTIATLAERVSSQWSEIRAQGPEIRGQRSVVTDHASRIAHHGTNIPLSFAQERLWFLEQLEPGQTFNHVPVGVRIEGPLALDAWRTAWSEIVRRHESLRTAFRTDHGQSAAYIADCLHPTGVEDGSALTWEAIDLRHVPEAERPDELARRIKEELRRPFDMTAAPLWTARLVRLAEEEHFLILNLHHTISDGWSLGVLFRELKSLYEAARSGRPCTLPKLPIRYSDYAAWQRGWMQGETLERHLAYWKKQLHGPPARLNLPTDRPRPSAQSYQGAKVFFALPSALAKALRNLSRQESVTQFMLLLGAFQTLLRRYSGQDDIAVGSPIAGRRRVETEGLIGLFANTLVFRADLSGDPTFREFMGRVRRTALDAYAHQDLPFEKLVEGVEAERDLSFSPLFQVMFIFQRSYMHSLEMGGLRLNPKVLDNGTSKFDLTLSLEEWGESLSGFIEYDTALFDPGTVTSLLAHYQTLLESVVANPGQRLSRLPMLAPEEKRQVLGRWNRTPTPLESEETVCDLFRRQVERTPDAEAVRCENLRLTYAELDGLSERLAHRLQSLGVGPERLVGIFLGSSLELVVALLAALKAGGAYLPLDPTYPQERLAFMLDDARPLAVLTMKEWVEGLPAFGGEVICLDETTTRRTPRGAGPDVSVAASSKPALTGTGGSGINARPNPRPLGRVLPDHLAYVIYTSGSTGKPKGVCVPHRGLTSFLRAIQDELRFSNRDSLLAVTTFSFDIAALEIFLPLTVGAQVILADRETATDGSRLSKMIAQSGATVMQATPATWRLLLETGWQGNPSLQILCGGESLARPVADSLLKCSTALWNLYGPTETTIWSTIHRVEPGEGLVPIGHPLGNTQVYILDQHQQPVPTGVAGELYIGGEGVARGYLNRPELTAERFVPHPFFGVGETDSNPRGLGGTGDASVPSGDSLSPRTPGKHGPALPRHDRGSAGRLYRTGDLARFRSNGTIEFLGRSDHQVKLRGYRIEPGEIEAALIRHSGVRNALVTLHAQEPESARLVAYVAVRPHCNVSFTELRDFLRESLPAPMIPSQFVLMDAFPLTLNGKIDRKALPIPRLSERMEKAELAPPKTPLEELLAEIWAKLFGLERVGVNENFFRLGGHSLLAVQLLARIRTTFKMELPLRTLFEAPTVEQFAQAIILRESSPGQAQKLAQLIKRVQGMSSKEVRKALRKTNGEESKLWTERPLPI